MRRFTHQSPSQEDREPSRQTYNEKILSKLEELVKRHPDQRFGQLIANYVLPDYREKDIFFEESKTTFENLCRVDDN